MQLEGRVQPRSRPLSTPSERITHEMRIAEVEIISMLMPAEASVSNMPGRHTGIGLHPPRPIRLTRAMLSSSEVWSAPSSSTRPEVTARAACSCSRGTVKLMSVTPLLDTFCTITSTLTSRSAQRPKQPAGHAGLVGDA